MKLIYIAFSVLSLSFIFTQSIYDSYDIPEYESRTFQINGDELLNLLESGDYSETNLNIGSKYMYMYQNPGYNSSYGLEFDFNSNSVTDGDLDTSMTDWNMKLPFNFETWYFALGFKPNSNNSILNLLNDNKGGFLFLNGELEMWGGDVYEDEDDTSDLPLTFGLGYGRIVSAKPIAQAYAIADALGIDANDETIMAISAIIGAFNSYESIYKDDATQEYYNDLAEAAGVSGSAMQIQKVLTSPAYNISDRFTGWDIRAGITNNYMQCDGCEDKGTMTLEANYAKPIDMKSQLSINLTYEVDLNDSDSTGFAMNNGLYDVISDNFTLDEELDANYMGIYGGHSNLNFSTKYTKDHSYNWSTSASLTFASDSYTEFNSYENSKDSISDSLFLIKISTTRAILNKLSLTGSFAWGQWGGDIGKENEDPFTQISSTLTYWVF